MGTRKLYMDSIDSCYLKEFDARVTSVNENSVILDQTLFYPLGGGQNWDTGKITWDGGQVSVTEVRGRGDVQHYVGEDHGLEVGDSIDGENEVTFFEFEIVFYSANKILPFE